MSDVIGVSDLFGMSDIRVDSFSERDDEIILFGEPRELKCPICGSTNVTKGSSYPRVLKDIPVKGKPTKLLISAYRVNCFNHKIKHSKRNNLAPTFEQIEAYSKMTKRLRLEIANSDFAHLTFKQIADRYYISDHEAAKILMEKAKLLDTQTAYPECTVIGIDEAHLGYIGRSNAPRMCSTIVDMSSEKTYLLDILPSSTMNTVKAALDRFSNPEIIKYVTMDMSNGYKGAVEECLPQATIIVDRFHVESYLNKAVGAAKKLATEAIKAELAQLPDGPYKTAELKRFRNRKENHYWFRRKMSFWNKADIIRAAIENGENVTQKQKNFADSLERQLGQFIALCNDYPLYAEIVSVHEAFAEAFEAPDRQTAEDMFDQAVKMLPPQEDKSNVLAPFWDFVKTVRNWRKYIFNYFDATDVAHRTNGPVEQWNHEIKAAHNAGRGYDFEVLRAKILFGKDKIILNEQNQFATNETTPFMKLTDSMSNVIRKREIDFNTFKVAPYHTKKLFTAAAKKNDTAEQLYKYIKAALMDPSDSFARSNVYEYLSISLPALYEAAEELDSNYRKQHEFIRYGVTIEEVREKASLIHQQIAEGVECDEILVAVEADSIEDDE